MLCVGLSIILLLVDVRSALLQSPRFVLSHLNAPIEYTANAPQRIVSSLRTGLMTRAKLIEENEKLKAQSLLLQRRVQRFASMTAENVRLRELLGSSSALQDSVLVAEIIGTDPDPFVHEVIINKGKDDGVFLGMPIIDAKGLMGQIISVAGYTSKGILLTDSRHSIPVEVVRNGVRTIAVGEGSLDALSLSHVADTTDIEESDILVSSGLGNRFPRGYPVGKVKKVIHSPGEQFAEVHVTPLAQIDRSRHVLLVFKEDANWFHRQLEELEKRASQNSTE